MACLENKIRTKTNDELLSETISSLRFPLTVGVVFIHFNLAPKVFSIHGVKYGLNNPDWYYFIINFFSDVLPCIGVPLFFFISGFLFFYKKEFNGTVYRQIMHRRATTLMLPYFLWNFIAIMIKASHKLSFLSSIFPNAYKTVIVISPKRLINTFIDNYENEGVFSINNVSFVDYMRKIKYIPLLYLLWAVIDTFTKETDYNIFIHELGIISGVISAVIVTSNLVESGRVLVNMTLVNCSFFVFAFHTLIMNDIGKALFIVFHLSDNTYSMLLLYFIVPIITIILSALIYIFLRRYLPVVCNILTGGR